MSAQTVAQTIQLILAPVVMITACAFITNGLMSRFTRINDRMRMLARERFDLLRTATQDVHARDDLFFQQRLSETDNQLPRLLQRHQLLRNALLLLYCAMATFIVDMFVIGTSALFNLELFASIALVIFLVGVALVFATVLLEILEVIRSHHGLNDEVQKISELALPDSEQEDE